MSNQEMILSYALEQLVDKVSEWFPGKTVKLWNGKFKEAVYICMTGMQEANGHNRMENLKVVKEVEKLGEVEIQVPVPRYINLNVSIIPAYSDITESLKCTAVLVRNLTDNPFIPIEKYNWYGNEESRALIEDVENQELQFIPDELSSFLLYRKDCRITLGINSAIEEKITRVLKRQFTAVKK